MRKIEFRGKQIYNGKWVYGYLMQMYSHDRPFIGEWKNIGGEASVKDELFSSYNEVVPETIGQYTGRKYSDKTKIYEGDIVEYEDIEWIIEDRFYMNMNNNSYEQWLWDSDRISKIGNIHDNPELLEEKWNLRNIIV